jgi:integrase
LPSGVFRNAARACPVVRFGHLAIATARIDALHDLRHAFATTLFEEDVHPLIVSAVLGHASVSFTQQVYTHLTEDRTQLAADVMERALGGGA